MGLCGFMFGAMVGGGAGVYVAQNYNVPNIKKLTSTAAEIADNIEKRYRKPKLPTESPGSAGGSTGGGGGGAAAADAGKP